MAQVKKHAVREAILQAAFDLFATQGYAQTSLAQIAQASGIATSNIYVYFASKLDIMFALSRPWLLAQIAALESQTASIAEPRARLSRILTALWSEIPAADNCFANNIMQALANVGPSEAYSRELLLILEERLSAMIRACLPPERHALLDKDAVAHLSFMAFDGFVLNHKIRGPSRRMGAIVEVTCAMLIGE
jgi:AcrR family transcriptional regulator